jgi:ATP-dependent Clp protease protease subunit
LGECESAAALILTSGTKGKRYCFPLGEMMIHSPFGEDICGDWEKVKSQSKSIKNAHEKAINILCAATGKKRKTIENDMKKEPYMSAEEAVKYGLVDHIFTGKF